MAAGTFEVRSGDESTAVEARADGSVTISGVTYTVEALEPNLYRVSDGEQQWTVAVAGPPDDRWVSVDGRVLRLEVADGSSTRRLSRRGGPGALAAPMPATVVKVLVEPGAAVAQGDTLILLEAMKMELAVRAPRDGVVRALKCRPGELVQPGIALLDLE